MGESAIRGNVSHGDGVYKSTDAGKTWNNVGLANTHQISRVRVHPRDPNLVYVAAQGHVWGPNPERGIYRSKDGGKTWEKILFVSDQHGGFGPVHGPDEPADPLRRVLAGRAQALGAVFRRAGGRRLQVDRRRRHLEEARGRPSGGHRRQHRRRRLPGAAGARLGDRRGGEGRRLPVRGRRRKVDARQLGEQAPPARLVLLEDLRRPEERGRGLRPEHGALSLQRRRAHVRGDPASRTATTTTSGSIRTTRRG